MENNGEDHAAEWMRRDFEDSGDGLRKDIIPDQDQH